MLKRWRDVTVLKPFLPQMCLFLSGEYAMEFRYQKSTFYVWHLRQTAMDYS